MLIIKLAVFSKEARGPHSFPGKSTAQLGVDPFEAGCRTLTLPGVEQDERLHVCPVIEKRGHNGARERVLGFQ